MSPEKTIRTQAKAILSKNNWPAAVGVIVTLGVAVMTIIYLADMLVTGLDYLLNLFNIAIFEKFPVLSLLILFTLTFAGFILLLPLLMGSIRFMYLMSKTSEADYSEMFHYCREKRYFPCLKTYLGLLTKSLWQAAISFVPAIVTYFYATALSTKENNLSMLAYFISYILIVGGILLFNSLTTKYFLAVYYYIENDNLSTFDICRLSEQYMKKLGGTTVKLNFSLLPLTLACILIVPALFVLPYVMTVKATSAKWIVELSKRTENKDE